MAKRVFVTGIGVISAIGRDSKECYQLLLESRSGIGKMHHLQTIHKEEFPLGEVKMSDEELAGFAGLKNNKEFTRTTLLGLIAAREAIQNSQINLKDKYRTGLISATTVGGMCKSEILYREFLAQGGTKDFIDSHDCGDSTERIARAFGIFEFVTTINTACSSSANAIMLGARLIKQGKLDRVIVGGTDALSKFTLNGFNTLMILDKEHTRPFDDTRAGLNLGEGAGFLVIESEDIAVKDKILAEVKGYGNACDAFHQTASSDDGYGAKLAMEKALSSAGIQAQDIDYINAHGTGTSNNDISESRAIASIFGNNIPKFSSTKPFTGHTLGASGGIEAVFSVMAIQNNIVFPSLNFKHPMADLPLVPVTRLLTNTKVNHVLSNSFGFGGNNTTIILSKYN
jgi:3-oxoacyl-[acyl-carrier-protein] synthase II